MDLMQQSIAAVLTCCVLMQSVSAFSCYQCNSTLDHNCQEFFDHDSPHIPLRSTNCKMYNAKHCIKATGLWGGIVGTHRFCSSRDLGNQCQDMNFPDHNRKYRGCIYTCGSSGCNSATSLHNTMATVTTVISTIFSLIWR